MQATEAAADDLLPSGELVFKPRTALQRFGTSLKLLRALPWRRFKKGSVLTLEASLPLALYSGAVPGWYMSMCSEICYLSVF